jgi:1-deoxy-D-xylulose-5-phosphate reductoisomerase
MPHETEKPTFHDCYISGLPHTADFPRKLVVLGSTGSIGVNALKVIDEHPDDFIVIGLAGASNYKLLADQAVKYRPDHLGVIDDETALRLKGLLPSDYSPEIHAGQTGYVEMAALAESDIVLAAQVGAAGLPPAHAAAEAGKILALANKEALVLGGHLLREACSRTGAAILPVDSEHNALFQAMAGHGHDPIKRLVLTASGGPFLGRAQAELSEVSLEEAVAHPNWSMGVKISIDSATLMNKGLEVIEACRLFGLPPELVEVVIHPQSIVHSLVEFADCSMLAHLGPPDMRIPIAYALGYPKRLDLTIEPLDLVSAGNLTFQAPSLDMFPCLGLAYRALEAGPAYTAAVNAANEIAVAEFASGGIRFTDIAVLIERTLENFDDRDASSLDAVLEIDNLARLETQRLIGA